MTPDIDLGYKSLASVANELGANPTKAAANNFSSSVHRTAHRVEKYFNNYSDALNAAEIAVTTHQDQVPVNKQGHFKVGNATRVILKGR